MPVHLPTFAVFAAQTAVTAQLERYRQRAAVDARWAPEVARLEAAEAAMARAIDLALGVDR